MRKFNNPDCCPCQTGCTKFCVTVIGYGDQVVSGLPVTYSGTDGGSPWTHTAVTDAEGKYCYTVTGTEKPKSVTVEGDCDSGALFYYDPGNIDTCSATLFYCSYTITFSVNPAASPVISSVPNLFATETRSEDGSEVKWTWCRLNTGFGNADTYPKNVTFTAITYDPRGWQYGTNPLYPAICKNLAINCGNDYTLDLVQSYWGDCYFGAQSCDKGCTKGVGPDQRGLVSKNLNVRFSSVDNRFAGDEGGWITVNGTNYGSTQNANVSWDSGPRGSQGHYQSADWICGYALYGCYLNNPAPYEKMRISYVGTNVQITSTLLTYRRISGTNGNDRCPNVVTPCNTAGGNGCGCYWSSDTGLLCRDCVTFATLSGIGCAPVDVICGEWTSSANGYTYSFCVNASDYSSFAANKDILWTGEIRDAC